jgi:hypothetical protein
MLGAQGLWAGRDLYRATPAVTRDLGFSGLIRRTAPFSRLLRHAWGCGGPILTRILTGLTKRTYTTEFDIHASYLNILLNIDSNGRLTTTLYDKRWSFATVT